MFYQVTPKHVMKSIKTVNRIRALKPCRKCGSVEHRINEYKTERGYPYYYITQEALDDLKGLNRTKEDFDMHKPLYVVSREVYDYLVSIQPRMLFNPVYLK